VSSTLPALFPFLFLHELEKGRQSGKKMRRRKRVRLEEKKDTYLGISSGIPGHRHFCGF
jgi:hypothetical protein